MLSVLVLRRGEPVAPTVIADAVWGEHPPVTWTKQVQTTMVRLRANLGRSSIATSSIGYVLDVDPEAIDAARFEKFAHAAAELRSRGDPERAVDECRRALALWRGPAYSAIPSWEPAVIEAARLEEVRSTAEEELAAAHLDCGEQHSVIAGAEALVREQPLRERRWSLLATALYRSGRQADALAALRAARVRFSAELGIEPGPELTALEAAILHQDPSLLPPPRSPQPSADCPYKGLHPYGIDDREEFFGRDADIAAILTRLDRARFIAVSGPSGCGKSSLVLAGVVPALARRGLSVRVISPSPTIAAQLRDALHSRRSADVVVVDQLEELFHGGFPPDEVHAVGGLIAEAAASRIVVATVRSDFLDECSAEPSLAPLLSESVHLVAAMSEEDLRAAIEEPARRAGLRLEAGLPELILRDAAGHSTALPLLSHALVETWLRRETNVLTIAGYEEVGGLSGAIASTAEQLFDDLTAAQRDACRSTMLRLVELGPDERPIRRYAKTSSLNDDPVRAAVVARLIRARLLSASDDTVAVTHELLALAWPRLHDWLEEDSAGARLLGTLTVAADAWEADGERDEDLYRGARLQNALDWRSASKPDLTSTESRFLDAAEHRARREEAEARLQLQRDRRQNRRLRVLFGATASLLGVSLLGTILVVGATQEADRQREAAVVEAAVSTSFALRESERDVAALIAAEAYRRWPDDARTRSALLGVFTAAQGFLGNRYMPGTDSIAGAVIGDTGHAVVVRDDESAAVVDMESGRTVRELDIGAPPGGFGLPPLVRVSADGRLAAILRPIDSPAGLYGLPDAEPSDETSQFLLVDLTTNRTRLGPVALDLGVGALALSPDGRHVAVADSQFEGRAGRGHGRDDRPRVGRAPSDRGPPARRRTAHPRRVRRLRPRRTTRRRDGRHPALGHRPRLGRHRREHSGPGGVNQCRHGGDERRTADRQRRRRARRGGSRDRGPAVVTGVRDCAARAMPVARGRAVAVDGLLRRSLGPNRGALARLGTPDRSTAGSAARRGRPAHRVPGRRRTRRDRRRVLGDLPMAPRRLRSDHPDDRARTGGGGRLRPVGNVDPRGRTRSLGGRIGAISSSTRCGIHARTPRAYGFQGWAGSSTG